MERNRPFLRGQVRREDLPQPCEEESNPGRTDPQDGSPYHPVVDGNKRTGFMAAVMFLERNGCGFRAGEVDAVVRTLGLAAGELTEADYALWLAENCSP